MPPAFLIAHASAHGAPNAGNEFSVVNWLRAAGIITGIDPVERGYLVKDALGRLRLAPVRQLGSMNVLASLPNQSNLLYEYVLQNLSDADFTYTGPAVVQSELFLRTLAPKFGDALQHGVPQPRADALVGGAGFYPVMRPGACRGWSRRLRS